MLKAVEELQTAIETLHRCKAVHEQSSWVVEEVENKSVWEGVVELFALTGHPRANHCYAWFQRNKGETQPVCVLETPLVVSPYAAVRAATAGGSQ